MKYLPFILAFTTLSSCGLLFPYWRAPLSIDRTMHIGEHFTTNGFYYAVNDTFGREPLTYVIILFGNGNIFGDYWSSESPDMLKEYYAPLVE